jgi:hypothetical protein
MDNLFSVLALALQANCANGFDKAWISAQISEDFSKQRYTCEKDGVVTYPDLSAIETSNIGDVLREIRQTMKQDDRDPWSRCTFTLFPDGKFTFDVEYDD